MNTNIYQTIRVAMVLVVALFAFVSDALAAPILTPATATRISENSAMLVGHVSNPYKSTAVWFEVLNDTGSFVAVGVQPPLYDGGTSVTFDYLLRDLNQGQTYSFRSAAMEGGVTVYSATATFTTAAPKVVTPVTVTSPSNSSTAPAVKTTQPVAKTPVVKEATVAPVTTSEGFTNSNSAAIIGAGNGLLPTTLIGWIILIIAILAVTLLGHMVYESIEKRKKAREEKELEEEIKDEEDTETE